MRCRVNAIPHEGFCRLGRRWPCAGVEVDLDERELAVLRGESLLRVKMLDPVEDEEGRPFCPKCAELGGKRPCSLECWVRAGYPAENYERMWGEGGKGWDALPESELLHEPVVEPESEPEPQSQPEKKHEQPRGKKR